MLILLDCMTGGLGVERGGCYGPYGLEGKKGSYHSFRDAFLTNQAQNKALQVVLQDVLIHLHDPMFSYRYRLKE